MLEWEFSLRYFCCCTISINKTIVGHVLKLYCNYGYFIYRNIDLLIFLGFRTFLVEIVSLLCAPFAELNLYSCVTMLIAIINVLHHTSSPLLSSLKIVKFRACMLTSLTQYNCHQLPVLGKLS